MYTYLILISLCFFPFITNASEVLTDNEQKYIDENPTLSVAMLSEPWFPYAEISMSGDYKGIYVDYIKYIFSKKGVDIKFNRYDTVKEILESVKEGSSNIALGYSPSKKRESTFLFSKPLFESSISVYYKDNNISSLPINKISWTCVLGTVYCDKLEEIGAVNIHEVESFDKSIELVNSGIVDAIISSYVTISEYISVNKISKGIVKIPDWLELEKISIITSNENEVLISIINKLMNSKEFNRNEIADIYLNNDWANIAFRQLKKGQKIIKYSFNENREPLFYRNEDGQLTGYLYDFINLIERRTGLMFEYVPKNKEDVWDMFYSGRINLIPLVYSDSHNKEGLLFSNPYMSMVYVSIENKIRTDREKENIGVLVSENNESLNLIRKDITKDSFVYTNIKKLINDLSNEKIDVAYISKDLLQGVIVNDVDNKFIIGAREDRIFKVSFSLSNENEELMKVINSALKIIDKEEFRKIKRSYRKFNVIYGYEKNTVLKIVFVVTIFILLISLVVYFWLNNLKLQVKVKDKDKVNLEKDKTWLQGIISELPTRIFIHNKDKDVVLSNCYFYNKEHCGNCIFSYELNSEITDNIFLNDLVITNEISITNCKFDYKFVNKVRKRIYEERSGEYYLLTVISDISQQKNQESALIEANEKTKKALVYREQFLANMSHELRTPIAGITGLLELLSKRIKGVEKQSLVDNISGSMNHLHMLVNDILDYSKLEAEQLSLDKRDCHYLNVLNELFRLHNASANEKGLNLYITIEPTLSEVISIDSLRLSQIINNLISNAIKFTNKGYVEVTVSILDNNLNFDISDTGIGISKENLDRVFKPFTQADNSIVREYGGTGLGLNIVNELIKLMGGSLSIKSIEKIGTSINFSIPINVVSEFKYPVRQLSITCEVNDENLRQWLSIFSDNSFGAKCNVLITNKSEVDNEYNETIYLNSINDDDKSRISNHHYINSSPIFLDQLLNTLVYIQNGKKENEDESLTRLKGTVLISEDNRINQELLVNQLEEIGLNSIVTSNGKEAWEVIKKDYNKFDLLITDCHMPIMDGFELSKKIRNELPIFNEKAIIGCTAEDSRSIRVNSDICGFDDVLFKPYGLKQLHKTLSKHLNNNNIRACFFDINKKNLMPIFIESITDDYNTLVSCMDQESMSSILHKMKGGFNSVNMLRFVPMINTLSKCEYGEESYNEKKEILISEVKTILLNASEWYELNNE
ncbi:hypothetical protein A6E05_13695 [Aliivibrio sp. 1S165]|nr:hypothetical protein A6E05_13695 [Aliivibrio sp. 1S165]OCH34334.1 hypothetical protein A6E06_00435 [Aliivibrio sp. 1S175]